MIVGIAGYYMQLSCWTSCLC